MNAIKFMPIDYKKGIVTLNKLYFMNFPGISFTSKPQGQTSVFTKSHSKNKAKHYYVSPKFSMFSICITTKHAKQDNLT